MACWFGTCGVEVRYGVWIHGVKASGSSFFAYFNFAFGEETDIGMGNMGTGTGHEIRRSRVFSIYDLWDEDMESWGVWGSRSDWQGSIALGILFAWELICTIHHILLLATGMAQNMAS
jgi:hypothetical protein